MVEILRCNKVYVSINSEDFSLENLFYLPEIREIIFQTFQQILFPPQHFSNETGDCRYFRGAKRILP